MCTAIWTYMYHSVWLFFNKMFMYAHRLVVVVFFPLFTNAWSFGLHTCACVCVCVRARARACVWERERVPEAEEGDCIREVCKAYLNLPGVLQQHQ